MSIEIIVGDCREALAKLDDGSVHCCVTSPPYFGLRDYGVDGQMGLEATPDEFIDGMVDVFREVRRVLRDDGTLWLNIGDSYSSNPGAPSKRGIENDGYERKNRLARGRAAVRSGDIKPKDLMGMPWMLAFALRADGWYLREEIIWHKLNPMPEAVRDRCTRAHEQVFHLSKSARYYHDADALREPASPNTHARRAKDGDPKISEKTAGATFKVKNNASMSAAIRDVLPDRNRRSVWPIVAQPYKEAHFATFPPALVEPCIMGGCPAGGTVLDPFGGAGTTGLVADRLGRSAILIELNPEYAELARARIAADRGPLFA